MRDITAAATAGAISQIRTTQIQIRVPKVRKNAIPTPTATRVMAAKTVSVQSVMERTGTAVVTAIVTSVPVVSAAGVNSTILVIPIRIIPAQTTLPTAVQTTLQTAVRQILTTAEKRKDQMNPAKNRADARQLRSNY